ncbi:thioredoxin family protein [Salinibacterium sp.]|uniref:TlpA family protein disulfide reductase n=1 Tax=Salinibacterium sp. TaxID=1915057 RepID=UPI00286C9829|nr:thioredoxin family protein [Salinibacterium sp.]
MNFILIAVTLFGLTALATAVGVVWRRSPCRMTHSVLDELARQRDGVRHVDIDLGLRPELAVRFRIVQTPTTLILDRSGVVRSRIGSAARRDVVSSELDRLLVA